MDDTRPDAGSDEACDLQAARDELVRRLRRHPGVSDGVLAFAAELESIGPVAELEAVFSFLAQVRSREA